MTDPIANAAADLESLKALKALEDRLRMPRCAYCELQMIATAYCCPRCGWLTGEKFKSA